MARLAQVHSRAGNDIAPDLYDCWLDCLVSTVGDFDPQFTPEVELAWRLTLAPGIACLRFGYDQPVA